MPVVRGTPPLSPRLLADAELSSNSSTALPDGLTNGRGSVAMLAVTGLLPAVTARPPQLLRSTGATTARRTAPSPSRPRQNVAQRAQRPLPPTPVLRRGPLQVVFASREFEGEARRLGLRAGLPTSPRLISFLCYAAALTAMPSSLQAQFVGPHRGLGRREPCAPSLVVSPLRQPPCRASHLRRQRQMKTVKCTRRMVEEAVAATRPPLGTPLWLRASGRGSRGSEACWRRTRGRTRQLLALGTTAAIKEAPAKSKC